MEKQERITIVTVGNAPDPLLEEIVHAEGFEVFHADSVATAIPQSGEPTPAAIIFLMGDMTWTQISHTLHATAEALPKCKFILVLPERQGSPYGPDINPDLSERVLMLHGETGARDNVARIRRFLRGEGYRWASDLAPIDANTSVLDGTVETDEHQQKETRDLLKFAADLSKFTELQPMLQEALRRGLEFLACQAGSIYLWDENSETLILEAAIGPEPDKRLGLRQRLGEGLAGWVAEVGEPILVTDTRKVGKLQGRKCNRYGDFSCIAVPITHGGQLFGVICLTMPNDARSFGPQDLRTAQGLSERLAGVIRPLSVLSELRRFSERLLGAFQTSSDLVQEKDAQVASLRVLHSNILDSMPLAVISYDPLLAIRSSNQAARKLFGDAAAPGFTGAGLPLAGGLDIDPDVWQARLESVLASGQQVRVQRVLYRSEQGEDQVLDVLCSPLCDSEDRIVGGIITAQDVTEDIEMEAKLSSAERLALIGKLAAKVAHELNNPLDGILRFLNLALRQLDKPDKAREYLEESKMGLLRMSNILSELLTFSRSQRGGSRPVSLTQVINQSLAQYEQRARESGITIDLDIPPDLPVSPSNDVWEVFANVVKNAIDCMKDGGNLRVVARNGGALVHILISDTGPGVTESVRDKIFDPFFTTKPAGHGTGLGLALCRDSLRRIGGDIQLLPSDEGATFEILVPTKVQP
jgi:signal transduction histidine kinase